MSYVDLNKAVSQELGKKKENGVMIVALSLFYMLDEKYEKLLGITGRKVKR